ncbi:MAG: caspase family protein [Desulfobacteraceae bacterium]|nr:caspase family protein [Desulfobacteraceae bacterium]
MMKSPLFRLVTIACLLLLLTPSDSASVQENKIALIIGNGEYKTSHLANPVNDANDMATALNKCNFKVMKSINATKKEMRRLIRKFGEEINKGAVGLFYYAGHGIQVDGENYLVPVNAEVYTEAEVEDECLKVSSVLRQMESAGNRLNIIILDACRDNPFGRSFRSSNMGLAKMDAPTGSILAYSTAPGSVAADGTGRNGLYTSMLLKHMMEPDLVIERVFKKVRVDVMKESSKRQVPWESSSLTGDFYFNSKRGIAVTKLPIVESEKPIKETTKYTSISPKVTRPEVVAHDGNFIAYSNGVVYDKITGLEWYAGPDKSTNWNEAKRWVESLNVAVGGWRMPTTKELRTLYKRGKRGGNMTHLLRSSGLWVWSGEIKDTSSAWGFGFSVGYEYWENRNASSGARGFAVRSRR